MPWFIPWSARSQCICYPPVRHLLSLCSQMSCPTLLSSRSFQLKLDHVPIPSPLLISKALLLWSVLGCCWFLPFGIAIDSMDWVFQVNVSLNWDARLSQHFQNILLLSERPPIIATFLLVNKSPSVPQGWYPFPIFPLLVFQHLNNSQLRSCLFGILVCFLSSWLCADW